MKAIAQTDQHTDRDSQIESDHSTLVVHYVRTEPFMLSFVF